MKKALILVLFATCLSAQQQTKVAPDCQVVLPLSTVPTVSGTVAGQGIWDNRPSSFNQGQPCTYWELHYSAYTTTSSFSIQMESAGDNSGVPGSFSIFGSAGTTVPTGTVSTNGYVAFIRINLTAVSSGTVSAILNGWRANAITINGGSTGPASNVNIAQVAGVSTSGGPNLTVNETEIGGLAIVPDPCIQQNRTTALINTTSNAQIITGTAAKQTYVCFLQFSISSTADNIALVEGTGSVCASGTAGMAGGATAATGWNLLANGSVTGGTGTAYGYRTATLADNVCLLVSSGAQVSGVVQYVQQ